MKTTKYFNVFDHSFKLVTGAATETKRQPDAERPASSKDGCRPPELGDELVRLRARVSNGSAIGMKFP